MSVERTTWTKTVDGQERTAVVDEAEAGIVHVTTDLMYVLLQEAGWVQRTREDRL